MSRCLALEDVARWVLGELDPTEAERFEEHTFDCDPCFDRASRLERLVVQLRTSLPPFLTSERRRQLEGAARPELRAVHVRPGERAFLRLDATNPVGIWILRAELDGVARVDCEARDAGGELVFALTDVPFDAQRGEVALACQRHYAAVPGVRALHVRLTAVADATRRAIAEYVLEHDFA